MHGRNGLTPAQEIGQRGHQQGPRRAGWSLRRDERHREMTFLNSSKQDATLPGALDRKLRDQLAFRLFLELNGGEGVGIVLHPWLPGPWTSQEQLHGTLHASVYTVSSATVSSATVFSVAVSWWVQDHGRVTDPPRSIRQRLADNMRRLRSDRGWSQEDLAAFAQLHRNQIGVMEQGQRSVGIDIIEKLALAFQVSVGELLD